MLPADADAPGGKIDLTASCQPSFVLALWAHVIKCDSRSGLAAKLPEETWAGHKVLCVSPRHMIATLCEASARREKRGVKGIAAYFDLPVLRTCDCSAQRGCIDTSTHGYMLDLKRQTASSLF